MARAEAEEAPNSEDAVAVPSSVVLPRLWTHDMQRSTEPRVNGALRSKVAGEASSNFDYGDGMERPAGSGMTRATIHPDLIPLR